MALSFCPGPSPRSAAPPARAPLRLAPRPVEQGAFAFLAELPRREARRRERAHQPHLRARTPLAPVPQLLLPFQRPPVPRTGLLQPERADALEAALREARGQPKGSPRQRAAEGQLLLLLQPLLAAEARRAWATHERTHLSRADLEQEAALRAQGLWRRFVPGAAGPGRTLYPAYVGPAVRQHLGRVLAEARPVGPTEHGRKLAARARKHVEKEKKAGREVDYSEALRLEGADAATALALAQGATRCEEREASQVADTSGERLAELATEGAAVEALRHLPRRQQLAVAVPLGLEGPRRSDRQLAQHLKCTLTELLEAREQGLAALREHLEATC